MNRSVISVLVFAILISMSQEGVARPKQKNREKDHPNFQRYSDDEEYRSGRGTRLGGILLSSIGGSIGGGLLVVGMLWNTCVGATNEDRPRCKRNARETMAGGLIIGGGSLAAGIPMITIGREDMDRAKRRIDNQYPVKEETETNEASETGAPTKANRFSSNHPWDGVNLAVRVVNMEF